ncbi:MAG: peptide deformylase [Kiritimatiellae bacterium]|nr:peptide deformylase [Kiritimatiellia bacterium]
MVHKIVTYGDAVLRKQSMPVITITEDIRSLAKDMLETMYAASGAGLAAEQIGRTERICVIDVSYAHQDDEIANENPDTPMPMVLINPEITAHNGSQVGQEGCLSFPEIYANVKRSENVTCKYLDLEGTPREVEAKGLLSRAIQHELDHLNGVLLVDHMSHIQKMAVSGRLKRLKKESQA